MRVEISADINKSTNHTSYYLSINTLNKYLLMRGVINVMMSLMSLRVF
jgi:hypothetical protein